MHALSFLHTVVFLLSVSGGRGKSEGKEIETKGRKDTRTITIDTLPAIFTFHTICLLLEDDAGLRLLVSRTLSPGQFSQYEGRKKKGRTKIQTINAAPSRGTFTPPIIRITVPVLTTCKDGEEAVEARRALSFIRGMICSALICGGVEHEIRQGG